MKLYGVAFTKGGLKLTGGVIPILFSTRGAATIYARDYNRDVRLYSMNSNADTLEVVAISLTVERAV